MVVPLFVVNEQFGLLIVHESEKGYAYREKKIEIISGIARHISLAIQNERLKQEMIDREKIRKEFQLAQDIQKTFLPENLPLIPGWRVSVRWKLVQQVGGDFYDVFLLNENCLGLVIADVSDKGLPATLYMTVTRTLLHAEALEGSSPSETFQRVNELLLLNSKEGLFATCLYAIWNTITGEFTYANAEHNKPIWLKRTHREMTWLEMGGIPLGVVEGLN